MKPKTASNTDSVAIERTAANQLEIISESEMEGAMRIAGLLAGMLLILSFDARADFYKYKDSSGALVITDKLENVPQKYRNQFKVVWDADLEAKDSLARRKAEAKALQERQEQEQQKASEKKKPSDGKRVVITIDEATGKLIRTLE